MPELWPLGAMSLPAQSASSFWKWALIIASLIVVAEDIAVRATPYMRRYSGLSGLAGMLTVAALLFLLFGSPFLVRSQRWLAIVGWFVAAASILLAA